jgi:hypothetical protein
VDGRFIPPSLFIHRENSSLRGAKRRGNPVPSIQTAHIAAVRPGLSQVTSHIPASPPFIASPPRHTQAVSCARVFVKEDLSREDSQPFVLSVPIITRFRPFVEPAFLHTPTFD